MNSNFQEISLSRAKRILGFLSKDNEILSSYAILAFGHWHGNKQKIKNINSKFDFEILHYQKENSSIWHFALFFLSGDRFCIRIDKPGQILDIYNNFLDNFLSISFYIIEKDYLKSFLSNISPDFRENMADYFLENCNVKYLIYRVDADAPVESGVTEELCYTHNTPAQWLSYFTL